MPSFDVVSEVDLHEVRNAVDQASREVNQRFDFKGTNSHFDVKEAEVTLHSTSDFQLKQMMDIFEAKLIKRKVDIGSLDRQEPEIKTKDKLEMKPEEEIHENNEEMVNLLN